MAGEFQSFAENGEFSGDFSCTGAEKTLGNNSNVRVVFFGEM